MKKIMFVCLGNICRSPLAHAVMLDLVETANLSQEIGVDSSGIGNWHIGQKSDPRVLKIANAHGLTISHRAQQFKSSHGNQFDIIFAMDSQNRNDILHRLPKNHSAKVFLFRQFDTCTDGDNIKDPYYGAEEGFEQCFREIKRNCMIILEKLKNKEL